MSKEIIIRSNSTAVDFALLKDGKLIELHKQNDSNKFNVGDIFLAKTKKICWGTQCCICKCRPRKRWFFTLS